MAIELKYNEAYATVAEADAFLAGDSTWGNLSTNEKDDALLWGRYYIDDNFECFLSSLDSIPDELKYSNSLLATDFVTNGTLYKETAVSSGLKKKKVKAGDVETETEYFESEDSSVIAPPSIRKVRSVLAPICERTSGTGTVNLVRA